MAFGTSLKRVDPFQELMGIQERMNQLFRSSFSGYSNEDIASGAWAPAVDIYEAPESVTMTFELPGLQQQDIQVNLENNLLTVTGERKLEHEDKREGYHRIERNYGSFSRSFTLPSSVDPNQIKAEFANGLLQLTLPKRPETQPRAIVIQTKS